MTVIYFVDLFVTIFNLLLIARVLCNYLVSPGNRFFLAMVELTEPILIPVRKLLPQTPGVDWAPLVAFFVLQGLQALIHWLLGV